MKPFRIFLLSAAMLALLIVPAMPTTGAAAAADSQYSIYRAWSDTIINAPPGYGTYSTEDHYGNISAIVESNRVIVQGRLQIDCDMAPYSRYVNAEYLPGTAFITSSMTLCWLDEDLEKQAREVSKCGYGQTSLGRTNTILYLYEYNVDLHGSLTSRAVWLEDITITIALKTIRQTYKDIAVWKASAAFCECIYLMTDHTSSDSPDYRISDRWDHPSASSMYWQGVMYGGEWHHTDASTWTESLRLDWTRHDAILASRSVDDVTNRSGLYGYAESMLARIESVLAWQNALVKDTLGSPYLMAIDADGDDFSTGAGKAKDAYDLCKSVQQHIRSGGDYGEIQEDLTRALKDYQLAILYTDREIMTNGLENVNYEWEEVETYVETKMNVPIGMLETEAQYNPAEPAGPSEPSQLMLWISSGSNAVILGAAVALAGVAVIWRSGFVALMAVAAAAVAALSYMGGIS